MSNMVKIKLYHMLNSFYFYDRLNNPNNWKIHWERTVQFRYIIKYSSISYTPGNIFVPTNTNLSLEGFLMSYTEATKTESVLLCGGNAAASVAPVTWMSCRHAAKSSVTPRHPPSHRLPLRWTPAGSRILNTASLCTTCHLCASKSSLLPPTHTLCTPTLHRNPSIF